MADCADAVSDDERQERDEREAEARREAFDAAVAALPEKHQALFAALRAGENITARALALGRVPANDLKLAQRLKARVAGEALRRYPLIVARRAEEERQRKAMAQRREEEETAGPAQPTMATVEYIETTNRWMQAHPEDPRTVAAHCHLRQSRLATEEGDEDVARSAWRKVRRAVHAVQAGDHC